MPRARLAASARVLDFEGAGVAGGDLVNLSSSPYLSFQGQITANPVSGAALAGAGNGLTDVFYTLKDGSTWLLADENDNGVLDATDTAIQFSGVHAFTEADFTASSNFAIAGTARADILVGTQDDDVMFGLGGNDRLDGGAGNDLLYGGAGSDTLSGGPGFDMLYGDAGNDTLSLQDSNFGGSAYGGEGADVLIGSDTTRSTLDGGAGNDTLRAGAAGADLVDFEGGNDRLIGGAGDDVFFGGAGKDLFVFGATWTAATGFQDVIADFEDGLDRIDLRGSGLTFADLSIDDSGYSAVITSSAGRIEVTVVGQPSAGALTQADFLFG